MKNLFKFAFAFVVLFAVAVLFLHDRKSAPAGGNETRLEVYYMYNEGESQADWFAAAGKRFEGLHPGVEVKILFAGREVLQKLRPRVLTQNPPDIVNQGGDQLEPLMTDGLFEELDDVLETPAYGEDTAWKDTFLPGLLEIYRYKGHDYQIPAGLFCTVFFYNIAQFETLSLTPPKTWNEFLKVCETLKKNGIEPIAADGTEPGYNIMWYSMLVGRTSNIEHIRAAAFNAPGTSWQEKAFVDAAKLVHELFQKGYIMEGHQGSKWPSAQMQWIQGKCGLLLCGTWIPKEMQNKLPPGFRMGIFRFPVVEGYPDGDPWTQDINSESYAIPKGAKQRELAIEFLKFVSSKEESRYLVDIDVACGTKGVPMPKGLVGLDEMLAPPYRLVENNAGIKNDLSDWYRIVARNLWSDLFLGSIGPEEMCAEMDASQERFYERRKALGKIEGQ